jgi:hypothetical protein
VNIKAQLRALLPGALTAFTWQMSGVRVPLRPPSTRGFAPGRFLASADGATSVPLHVRIVTVDAGAPRGVVHSLMYDYGGFAEATWPKSGDIASPYGQNCEPEPARLRTERSPCLGRCVRAHGRLSFRGRVYRWPERDGLDTFGGPPKRRHCPHRHSTWPCR